jgi:hypothetical protein
MHLNGALAVTDVMWLLVGHFVHVGEKSGQVVICHVLEGEFPKLFIFVRVVFGVVS